MNVKRFAMLLVLSVAAMARAQQNDTLKVSFIDVEGGQATLFVTPAGESLLIDTGWADNNNRDADRIVAAARAAGLTKLDYVLITHFHDDHVGGVPQLVAKMPVGTFIDHGVNRELDHGAVEHNFAEYQKVLAMGRSKRIVARPGDVLPIKGITATVISADGNLITTPLPGAGQPNDACKISPPRPADTTENVRSLGIEIQFGKLKLLDLGDLTADKELELMCPSNKLGHVDVLVVSHHGWSQSSSPALVYGVSPRVAIMDNGEKKGGSPGPLEVIKSSPGLEALYELHYSLESADKNTSAENIANLASTGSKPDSGYGIELAAHKDGSFIVTNDRTKEANRYKP